MVDVSEGSGVDRSMEKENDQLASNVTEGKVRTSQEGKNKYDFSKHL